MKQIEDQNKAYGAKPAAFRRLCVETGIPANPSKPIKPAAFRRLCVETHTKESVKLWRPTSRL